MKTHQIHFQFFSLFSQIDDPLTFEEVVKDDAWAQAMDEEIICIENNQSWKLVDVLEDKDVITVKWCNTLFPPICKNNWTGQELWQTHKCEYVM
jgi:hypothetical protein